MKDIIQQLSKSDQAYIRFNAKVKLLGLKPSSRKVVADKQAMLEDSRIKQIIKELNSWPGYAIKRHNDAKHPIHKLAFLADIGFTKNDSVMKPVVKKVLALQSKEGPFEIKVNIPKHFGGSGRNELSWMFCDAVVVIYALLKLGVYNKQVKKAVDYLVSLLREEGAWTCASSPKMGGKFKGPGSLKNPCPYVNLWMVKLLALVPKYRNSKAIKIGIETLLDLWTRRKKYKPFLFAMGTDFKKLKLPYIWYDILHVVKVLNQFAWVQKDRRFKAMKAVIDKKPTVNGFYKPESVWMTWKEWDFGQKKENSEWLTLEILNL